jgi:hypothetical protein
MVWELHAMSRICAEFVEMLLFKMWCPLNLSFMSHIPDIGNEVKITINLVCSYQFWKYSSMISETVFDSSEEHSLIKLYN